MSKVLKSLLFCLLSITFFLAHAQPENNPVGFMSKEMVIPPSPEAASLGKYGDAPVSLFTGTVSTSVPIYEIKYKDLSIPISLNYTTGGFKHDEKSGNIGLGWTLNAGAVISRAALGRPDNCTNYYGNQSRLNTLFGSTDEVFRQNEYLEISKGLFETEPDAFNFNIPGHSGSFFIDMNHNIMMKQYSPVKLERVGSVCIDANTSFEITDLSGNVYVFDKKDSTTVLYNDDILSQNIGPGVIDYFEYISSWYVSEIRTANGAGVVTFEYDKKPLSEQYSSWFASKSGSVTFHGATDSYGNGATGPQGNESAITQNASAVVSSNRHRLTKITFRDTEIEFITDEGGGLPHRIDEIIIKEDGQQIKKFELQHSGFGDGRLKLDQVDIKGADGTDFSPPYVFSYEPMPVQGGIDHWGYYNGTSASTVVPTVEINGYQYGEGANRGASGESEAGVMKSVTYPTGGRTEFEFEVNVQSDGPPPFVQTTYEEVTDKLSNYALGFGGDNPPGHPCAGWVEKYGSSFAVYPDNVRVEITPPSTVWDEPTHGEDPMVFFGIINRDNYVDPGCDIETYVLNNYTSFDYYWWLNGGGYGTMVPPTMLDTGTYEVIMFNEFSSIYLSGSVETFEMDWVDRVIEPDQVDAGGVRIKSVTNYHDATRVASKKEFEYELAPVELLGIVREGFSSGVIYGTPSYVTSSSYEFEAATDFDPNQYHLIDYTANTVSFTSSSREVLGGVKGSHIGYSRVIERQKDTSGNSNGYKVYHFRNDSPVIHSAPFSHTPDDFGNGDLLLEEVYDDLDSLLSKSERKYSFDKVEYLTQGGPPTYGESTHRGSITGVKVYPSSSQSNRNMLIEHPNNSNVFTWVEQYNWEVHADGINQLYLSQITNKQHFDKVNIGTQFKHHGYWQYPLEVRNVQFMGTDSIESVTSMGYNSTSSQLTFSETTNSKGDSLRTEIYYANSSLPSNISSDAAVAKSTLSGKHILSKPLEELVYKNNELISAQRIDYRQKTNPANSLTSAFPEDVFIAESSTPFTLAELDSKYAKRATYVHDDLGSIESYSKEGDVNEVFLWSNDQLSVVASAVNASSDEVAYTGFESQELGKWSYDTASTRNFPAGYHDKSIDLLDGAVTGNAPSGSDYFVCFWFRYSEPVLSMSVGTPVETRQSNGWTFKKYKFSGSGQFTLSATTSCLVDELRLYPVDAQMTTYVHKPGYGVVAQTGPDERISRYVYDTNGRLIEIKDQDDNLIKAHKYKFGQPSPGQ